MLGIGAVADELADRHGPELPGRLRPAAPAGAALRADRAQRSARAPVPVADLDDPALRRRARRAALRASCATRSSCSTAAGATFDRERVPAGQGHAGVLRQRGEQLRRRAVPRRALVELAPPPTPRAPAIGAGRAHDDERFCGFVFKIQANMDPHHRDRIAFMRVVLRPLRARHDASTTRASAARCGLTRPHRSSPRSARRVEEAYPRRRRRRSSTPASSPSATRSTTARRSGSMPCRASLPSTSRASRRCHPTSASFSKGLEQLEEEGAIQVLFTDAAARRDPILAAVGELQFDRGPGSPFRGVRSRDEGRAIAVPLRARGGDGRARTTAQLGRARRARPRDCRGSWVALFEAEWAERHFRELNADVRLSRMA